MIVVTGAAGFIGMHVVLKLLAEGEAVFGLDNLNQYYDPALKQARLAKLNEQGGNFTFLQLDVSEPHALEHALAPYAERVTAIIHLAAQAGVRYSIEAPRSYISANIAGMMEVLETARRLPALQHLVYASSSSVYGANRTLPYSPADRTDNPVSLYAATKKSCEVLAESYAQLYKLPMTGLRFFTVYGPWGRPDMAYFSFTRDILEGKTIKVYNHGDMRRDFTYIDDIVAGILAVLHRPATTGHSHRIYNLGNHRSEKLGDMISHLERLLGRKALIEWLPMQPGDVQETFADIADSTRDFGYQPRTILETGLASFVDWYRGYFGN